MKLHHSRRKAVATKRMSSRSNEKIHVIVTLSLLIQLLVYNYVHGWRPYIITVDKLTTESFSPKCRVNSSLTYPGLLNINLEVLQPITNSFSHTEVFLQSANDTYDLEILNRTVDMCRLMRDVTYEPILQVGYRLYKASNSKFIRGCFIKKGFYSLENLKLNVENMPPVFPEKNGYYSQDYLMDKAQVFLNVKVFFSVKRTYEKNNKNKN